jgi:hypothetical protein
MQGLSEGIDTLGECGDATSSAVLSMNTKGRMNMNEFSGTYKLVRVAQPWTAHPAGTECHSLRDFRDHSRPGYELRLFVLEDIDNLTDGARQEVNTRHSGDAECSLLCARHCKRVNHSVQLVPVVWIEFPMLN